MKLKSDCLFLLRSFAKMVSVQFGKQVKMIRTDNGAEFFSKEFTDFLLHCGIGHQSSCPHTPQQNGLVERIHRHILEVARVSGFKGIYHSPFGEIVC